MPVLLPTKTDTLFDRLPSVPDALDSVLLECIAQLNASADEHIDVAISDALERVRVAIGLRGVAVFKLSEDYRGLVPTHGRHEDMDALATMSWDVSDLGLPGIVRAAAEHGYLVVDGPSELVSTAAWERLEEAAVGSALVVPYSRAGSVRGLVIYMAGRALDWHQHSLGGLRFLGEALHGSIRRARTVRRMGAEVERYLSFCEATPQPVWCFELQPPAPVDAGRDQLIEAILDARLVDANVAFAKLFGADSAASFSGQQFADMVASIGIDTREIIGTFVDAQFSLPGVLYEHAAPDGDSVAHLRLRSTGIVRDGHLRYVWGSFSDVTERVESESARASIEQRMNLLMTQSREGVACFEWADSLDVDVPAQLVDRLRHATVVEASDLFARFFGFGDRGEVIGKPMLDVFGGAMPAWFERVGQAFAVTGFRLAEQVVPLGNAGDLDHVRVRLQGIFEGERLHQIWATVRDASAEVTAMRALERSEHAMSIALQAAELHTLEIDLQTGSMTLGASAARFWPDDQPTTVEAGRTIIADADRERVVSEYEGFISGRTDRLEVEFRVVDRTGGAERWLEMLGTALSRDDSGAPVRLTGLFRDVSERRQLEARMRSAQRLEGLGVLAGGIAHDFNNLLMSVLGHAQLSRRRLQSPDAVDESLREIERAALRAAELCDALLAYAGRGSYRPQELSLDDLVLDTRAMLSVSVPKGAQLDFEADAGELAIVQADRGQLQQVIVNLALNACEACGADGGSATVRTGLRELTRQQLDAMSEVGKLEPGLCAFIEVEDHGEGMTADVVERIFDPFFTTRFAGRGLGMASVLGAVRGHGGAIEIQSNRGEGTRVRVWLPLVDVGARPRAGNLLPLRGTVLVVDDESGVRQVVCEMFGVLGVKTVQADSGEAAVELYRDARGFDAVLMDLTMPGMDGTQTARELLRIDPRARIVFSSGYDQRALDAGFLNEAPRFIRKPYLLADIRAAFAEVLPEAAD